MTRYWENPKEYESRGIDYDLDACLEYNPQDEFVLDDIEKVIAVHEGERDKEDWRWVLRLKKRTPVGKYVFLAAVVIIRAGTEGHRLQANSLVQR